MITIKSFDGGEFDAYLALPAGGYGPGIVILQEIFGVNNYMRQICDWYASHGFVAICPDLFWRQERGVDITDQSEAEWQKAFTFYQGLDETKAVEDSAAAMEFLRKHPACNGRVGAVGFCLGGKLAWLLSTRFKPDCAVGYYGVGIEKSLNEAGSLASPLMLQVAGKDKFCPLEAQQQIHATLDSNPLAQFMIIPSRTMRSDGPAASITIDRLRNLRTCARWNSLSAISPAKDLRMRRRCFPIVGTNTSSTNSPRATRKTL